MPVRKADARWEGGLKGGKGNLNLGSGALSAPYSFSTRFGEEKGTNPEELIGAAHAACYSMAFSGALEGNGYDAKSVATKASVNIVKSGDGFEISEITLDMEADVPGIDDSKFQELAEDAKNNCPVSKALAGTNIKLNARLS